MAKESGPGGITAFIESNPSLALGSGVVLLLLVVGSLLKKKTMPTTNPNGLAGGGDLSGLQNGNIVYVPTQTTFSTINRNSGNTQTTTTTTVNPPPVINPPNIFFPPRPPIPQPKPPATGKALVWDQRYTIRGGQNLTMVAADVTRRLRAAGMPGSQSVTWHDLYAHNTSVINETAAAHHNPIPGGPWNDIFPGETITVPRWG